MPVSYNDGTPVEQEKFISTRKELLDRFSGVTFDFLPMTGYGPSPRGGVYEDEVARLVVDVEDSLENQQFFVQWKDALKERFRQTEIWMVAILLEVI